MRRVVSYVEVEVAPEDVMSLNEAARLLGLRNQAIVSAIARGRLTELVDAEARNPRRDRRFVLRAEVEEMAKRQ